MTENECGDYGRMLQEHLRAAGISDVVAALFMAGFSVGCTITRLKEPPPIEAVLPISLEMLKAPPTFVNPPPTKN